LSFASQFYDQLNRDVADGGNAAFERVLNLARERDLEIKAPAFAALVCWGERGFIAMKELALQTTTSKNISAAIKILTTVAAGADVAGPTYFLDDISLIENIRRQTNNGRLRNIAKFHLGQLIISLSTGDLLIPLGVAFMQLSLSEKDLAGELIAGLAAKWLQFGPSAIDDYERLIAARPDDERSFQDFFEKYPQFLDPMAVQMWSQPDFHGALEPDFVVRRADNSYLIIEIECPGKSIITRGDQLTAEATHAEKQVTDYRQFLLERMLETQSHFPHFKNPDCIAIIGLESSLSVMQRKALSNANSSRHNVRIVGFDWLSDRAKAIISNIHLGQVQITKGHRVI